MKTFQITRLFLWTAFFAFNIVSCTKTELTTISGSSSLIPTVSITAITQITSSAAIVDGDVSGDGGSAVTAKGMVWSTNENPTLESNNGFTSDGTGTGIFASNLSNLIPDTKYYVKAYATNKKGTAYGNQFVFTTNSIYATAISTTPVADLKTTTASSGGNISNDGGNVITSRGVCWSTSQNPTIADTKTVDGTGIGIYASSITGLVPHTTYYIRAYATNSTGTYYGNQISFTTYQITSAQTLPTLTTAPITEITSNSAVSGGTITDNGGGEITAQGVCWAITANPTTNDIVGMDGTLTNNFVSRTTWLQPLTKYYIRSFAKNPAGTGYGNELSFTTSAVGPIVFNSGLTYGSVSDIEGNTYKTIQIGTQVWMAENLRTTKYNDGTSIPNVPGFNEWSGLTTGAYCWYGNNVNYKAYGGLYNWFAVNTGKLCPDGWHIPSDAEWATLSAYLGGNNNAGGKLKETGITNWFIPNTGATNASGFTALPAGTRNVVGDPDFDDFSWIYLASYWWSSSESSINSAIYWRVFSDQNSIDSTSGFFKQSGFSVRCVKD